MTYAQPFLIGEPGPWVQVRDAQPSARALHRRHYSARARSADRDHLKFIGPGENMVLLTPDARALFAWRRFLDDSIDARTGERQAGVNCCIFRNEGAGRSSELIAAADQLADVRWPGERHYTYVDPSKVRSSNPGFCFLCAGWRRAGMTAGGLVVLERVAP